VDAETDGCTLTLRHNLQQDVRRDAARFRHRHVVVLQRRLDDVRQLGDLSRRHFLLAFVFLLKTNKCEVSETTQKRNFVKAAGKRWLSDNFSC
jgi:hypothetical protein